MSGTRAECRVPFQHPFWWIKSALQSTFCNVGLKFCMEHSELLPGACTSLSKRILQLFVIPRFTHLRCLHYTSLRGKGREFFCIWTVWVIFYSCFEGYVCYLYWDLDSIDIWQRTQFSKKQKSLTDGKQESNPRETLPEEEHEPEIYCWNQTSALGLSTTQPILPLTAVWLCTDARSCFLDLTKSGA